MQTNQLEHNEFFKNEFFKNEFKKEYFTKLKLFLHEEYQTKNIYPNLADIFNAFLLTPLTSVKVVLLGQDPYATPNTAHGLAFSVNENSKIPPSLKNIYKEIIADTGSLISDKGDLTSWAKQGVLLLNTILTVEENKPRSHAKKGWETFTDNVLTELNKTDTPICFILLGNDAIKKSKFLSSSKHLILTAAHPSPLARGKFFGSKVFSKANSYLKINGLAEIIW